MSPILEEWLVKVAIGAGAIFAAIIVGALLIASTARAAAPPPPVLIVSAIIDKSIVDKVGEATARSWINHTLNELENVYHDQVGLTVLTGHIDISHVSDDSQPLYLLAQVQRVRAADTLVYEANATIFFTDRELKIGEHSYYGYSVGGPICAPLPVAVVQVPQQDDLDVYVAAHELAHLFGVPHDGEGACASEAPNGHIMQAIGGGGKQFSQCSLQVLHAAISGSACLIPISVPVQSAAPPPPVQKTGAGSFDETVLIVLAVFAALLYVWVVFNDDAR